MLSITQFIPRQKKKEIILFTPQLYFSIMALQNRTVCEFVTYLRQHTLIRWAVYDLLFHTPPVLMITDGAH